MSKPNKNTTKNNKDNKPTGPVLSSNFYIILEL